MDVTEALNRLISGECDGAENWMACYTVVHDRGNMDDLKQRISALYIEQSIDVRALTRVARFFPDMASCVELLIKDYCVYDALYKSRIPYVIGLKAVVACDEVSGEVRDVASKKWAKLKNEAIIDADTEARSDGRLSDYARKLLSALDVPVAMIDKGGEDAELTPVLPTELAELVFLKFASFRELATTSKAVRALCVTRKLSPRCTKIDLADGSTMVMAGVAEA